MAELEPKLKQLFKFIDDHKKEYIKSLIQAVSYKSVSSDPECLGSVNGMIDWMVKLLEEIGATVEKVDIGVKNIPGRGDMILPNVIIGRIGNDFIKNTVILFNHLDVAPAKKEDGWPSDPFVLTIKNEKMYARGVSKSKGSILSWINAIDAFTKLEMEFPVNFLFVLESMGEMQSLGLEPLLMKLKEDVFYSADFTCCSSNSWMGNTRPCIGYGLRGISRFIVEIECTQKNVPSGPNGGALAEPMADMMYLLNSLTDVNGKILIKGMYKEVLNLTPAEIEQYANIDFDMEQIQKNNGVEQFIQDNKAEMLMHKWRSPSLTIHSVEPGYNTDVHNLQILGRVLGEFSIRTVPKQKPDLIQKYVYNHFIKKWHNRRTTNKMRVYLVDKVRPWIESPKHLHYQTARKAVRHVYKCEPDEIQEGYEIPMAFFLTQEIGKNAIQLPISSADNNIRDVNENLSISNYMNGIKLMASYFYELGKLC